MTTSALAKEYHVSTKGNDQNKGSASMPYKTISAAAKIAQPGDIITVHSGTYRERITPPRGGSSDTKRIVYRAAKGDKVQIKGSEVITGLEKTQQGVWKVIIPNSFFGNYNPYKDLINGDWFYRKEQNHHTGEVYLNGNSLFEKAKLEDVLNPKPYKDAFDKEASTYTWHCQSDEQNTTIWANFHDANPNKELVEINVRPSCFYPDTPGKNYITIQGFHMTQAATQWAAPTAEQIGLIGTHWSKGWIIENNVIRNSKCVGITLGKERKTGHNVWYNDKKKGGDIHYIEVVIRALKIGWSKENIGSHIVRNNTIYDCEAAGICGSLGAVFSQITGNHIYNIQRKRQFVGAETGAIKIHAAIDTIISNNYLHHADKGLWLDWMTQGTRVSGNLMHDNSEMDLFSEVNHGPYVVDNNIFLSPSSIVDMSQGGTFAHNIIMGNISRSGQARRTPYHVPHSTELIGLSDIGGGDNRFYNNIIAGNNGLDVYKKAKYPTSVDGNVYLKDAKPYDGEINFVNLPQFDPKVKLVEKNGAVYLDFTLPELKADWNHKLVTTELIGQAVVTYAPFENPDGSPLKIDVDYFGNKRDASNLSAGPFQKIEIGKNTIKVWGNN